MTKEKFLAYKKAKEDGMPEEHGEAVIKHIFLQSRQMLTHKDCFDIILNYDAYDKTYGSEKH
jgi:hypothetical protein